jgi:uncharacterized protein YutD
MVLLHFFITKKCYDKFFYYICCFFGTFFFNNIRRQMFSEKDPEKVNEYFCEICNFKCSYLVYWNRHLLTLKHQKATNVEQKNTQKSNQFFCQKCKYTCHKLSLWDRHIATSKHNKDPNSDKKIQLVNKYQCHCGKIYSHNASLQRHQLSCILNNNNNNNNNISNNMELIVKLLTQIIEQQKIPTINTNTNSHNTNSHNQFNLQFFLNEQCKDAMNLSDFVKNIQVTVSDLEHTGEVGYANGISAIIGKALENLDVYKRPIHCSNVKHETLYIKDEDKWEKETKEREKLINAIKEVGNKNIQQLGQWQKENPQYTDYESNTNDKYIHIVSNAMVGFETDEINTNYKKIVTNIAKQTTIDKTPN